MEIRDGDELVIVVPPGVDCARISVFCRRPHPEIEQHGHTPSTRIQLEAGVDYTIVQSPGQ
jgi:hypothetical protein